MAACKVSVRPLQIRKNGSSIHETGTYPTTVSCTTVCDFQTAEMTPPLTPAASCDSFQPSVVAQSLHFYDYLRATYSYHPPCDFDLSTVTLPLNRGDIILVHSVHSNGWADGTLLDSGRRGWLPTNYCQPFDPDQLRNLMRATTSFWDSFKDCAEGQSAAPNSQELVRGVIAGVRCFLVSRSSSNSEHTVRVGN